MWREKSHQSNILKIKKYSLKQEEKVNSNASLQNPAPDIITGPYMIVFEILISFRIIEVKRKN